MSLIKIKPLARPPKLSQQEVRRRAFAAGDRICGVQPQEPRGILSHARKWGRR
jgi:hypothetical protein